MDGVPKIRQIFADNLRRIIDMRPGRSARDWALAHKLEPRHITGMLKCKNAVTIDTLEVISKAIKVKPYKLLVPNLDPRNLPVVPESEAERLFYKNMRQASELLRASADRIESDRGDTRQ